MFCPVCVYIYSMYLSPWHAVNGKKWIWQLIVMQQEFLEDVTQILSVILLIIELIVCGIKLMLHVVSVYAKVTSSL